jgi:hypothetical protein
LGRMRETKVTNAELNSLYSAFSRVANWPHSFRGVTSPCWLSLWDRVLQGTPSISYMGLP